MALNVGINGFGRIGRIIFRTCFQNPCLKVSAINDPAVDIDYICYLIQFDSTHGKFKSTVERSDNEITIDGHKIAIFREKIPTNIPWQIADVQYVVEASGMFTNLEKASGHLTSDSVKRVLVTAPSPDVPMVVLGVNDDVVSAGHKVISCASSTLYCLAPIIKILEDNFGVSEGFITSIHAMTPSLKPLDGLCLKGKHWRDHRSIHQNIIPATTGACRALGKIIPQVKDKMTGLAFRVPIVNVSVLDITIRLKSNTTINGIIKQVENARNLNMKNIIKVSNEQAVSSDFLGETFSCILDSDSSLQLTSDFFKLICWYENEHSYACRIMDSILFLERQYQLEWKSKTSYIRTSPKGSLSPERECNNKITYHEACSYGCHTNSKSLCSTSEDSGFKSPKPLTKTPMSMRNFGTRRSPFSGREPNKNNEMFKMWNNENEIIRPPMRHNRGSFFHSCVAITPQLHTNTCMYVKTQERLEKVKMDFSKMANMTENLLKQSQHSKIEIGLSEVASNEVDDSNKQKVELDKMNFPLEKSSNYYTAKKANGDGSKATQGVNNTRTVISEETSINNETISVNSDNSKICNRSLDNKNSTNPSGLRKTKKFFLNPFLVHSKDFDNEKLPLGNTQKTSAELNNLISYSDKYKTTYPDNNVMQVSTSTYTCNRQKTSAELNNLISYSDKYKTTYPDNNIMQVSTSTYACNRQKTSAELNNLISYSDNYKTTYADKSVMQVSTSTNACNRQKTSAELNNLISYSDNYKTTYADKSVMQVSTSTNACKEKNECQNHTVNKNRIPSAHRLESITDTENNDCSRNECCKKEQESYLVSKQSLLQPSPSTALGNAKNKDASEDIDKREPENKPEVQNEQERNLQLRLEGILKKLAMGSNVASEKPSRCLSSINTITTASNRDIKNKQDIYDKLDSVSATDSENSFHMKERKSQVINITDLTNSLEDLERLDKICRIIEISDELSDQLLSALSTNDSKEVRNKRWSFKDLCEKIKLDDFCNKMFSKNI